MSTDTATSLAETASIDTTCTSETAMEAPVTTPETLTATDGTTPVVSTSRIKNTGRKGSVPNEASTIETTAQIFMDSTTPTTETPAARDTATSTSQTPTIQGIEPRISTPETSITRTQRVKSRTPISTTPKSSASKRGTQEPPVMSTNSETVTGHLLRGSSEAATPTLKAEPLAR